MLVPGSFWSLSIAGQTVFPRNSNDFQLSFSPFALKSFFLERMGITVVPWRSTFFSNLFQFDGGNSFSRIREDSAQVASNFV